MKRNETSAAKAQLISVISISLIAIVLVVGMSLKKRPKLVVVDATAEQVMPADTNDELADQPAENSKSVIERVFHSNGRFDVLAGEKLFTIMKDSSGWSAPSESELNAYGQQPNCILYQENQVILGGQKLIFANRANIAPAETALTEIFNECDLGAPVNVVLKFGEGYLVGTDGGLHFIDNAYVDTMLKADWLVTSMANEHGELWIGTFGDGLWQFDGEKWQRRYLLRDTTIFDFITALEYSYPYLWVGTPSGIFRYDGGVWQQLFVSDSSEVYNVNCVLPRLLNTYIGTEQGLFVFANDSLQAAPQFDTEKIVSLFKDGKDVLVATREHGIFTLKGKEGILRPEQLPTKEPYLAETK